MLGQRRQAEVAAKHGTPEGLVPAGIPLGLELFEGVVLHHGGGAFQGQRQHVHCGHVAMEQVHFVEALAAYLGVEVVATSLEATGLEYLVGDQGQLLDAVGELVGVPAVLRVAAVGVDAAEIPRDAAVAISW